MARKQVREERREGIRDTLEDARPYVLPVLACTFAALALLLAYQRADRLLTEDPRFTLQPAGRGEAIAPGIVVSGATRTQLAGIRRVFEADEGRSVYSIDLANRRRKLVDGLEWVLDASVQRLWPNRIAVEVVERAPVFLVNLRPGRGPETAMHAVDAEGKILPALAADKELAKFPVMTGVRRGQDEKEIIERVGLMKRIVADLGSDVKSVSEIDVADPDNVKLMYPIHGRKRALTLVVGDGHYHQRLRKFELNWPEVEKRMPRAIKLDLRIDGRINAMQFEEPEEPRSGD